jgi:tetratricopeptide (TPR) repeat protein
MSQATALVEDDDDYQLVAATCYIRLNDFQSAIDILNFILKRSPDNQKALYNMAFCRRAFGS